MEIASAGKNFFAADQFPNEPRSLTGNYFGCRYNRSTTIRNCQYVLNLTGTHRLTVTKNWKIQAVRMVKFQVYFYLTTKSKINIRAIPIKFTKILWPYTND